MLAIFQFDSPALPLLEQMLEQGRLPALAELRRRAEWERIDTDATVLQSATYPTLCTGIDVTEHGLYSSFPWSPSEQRVRFAHAFPKPPTIWERLTAGGRRSLVVDPILAWPPRRMAGVYVSGWHFEDRMLTPARSVPRGRRAGLAGRFGRPPRLDDVYGVRRVSALLDLQRHLVQAPARTADAVADLLDEQSFDLVWVNFSAAHKAGHHLWDPAAVVEESLDPDTERALREGLADVYAAVDRAIGRIAARLPDDADVIAFSPTGMGANTSRADLLPGMLDAMLNGNRRARTTVWSLRSRVPAPWRSRTARMLPDRLVADITTRLYTRADWRHTRAIAVPGESRGYVRLNLAGRERDGIVDPAEADDLLEAIAEGLLTFRDPDGSASVMAVARMAELAGGEPYAEQLPDLVVSWGERPASQLPGVSSPDHGDVERLGIGSGRSGHHVDDAWAVIVPGAAKVRARVRPVRITDIGATACSLLGAAMTGLSGDALLDSG